MNEAQARTVAVAGAGPVGLLTAIELARQGLKPILLETRSEVSWTSRAICISRRSLEIVDRVGVGAALAAKALPWSRGRTFHRDRLVFELAMPHSSDDRHAPFVNLQQCHTERFLLEGLEAMAEQADIRWGHRVIGVDQDADAVSLSIEAPDGNYRLSVPWLVAADGARSTVRQSLGLALHGTSYEGRYLISDIEVEGVDWPVERHVWFDAPANPGSTVILHVQPDGMWRIDCQLRDGEDAEEALRDEQLIPRLQSQLDMMGVTAPWRLAWKSLYRAHALSLDSYRHGRVLFAGDAAHLVPIFGVRGLNSGLDDAHNLGWKLGMVARSEAPPGLLDSYSDERRGATEENLANAIKSTWFMSPPTPGFRMMRDAALALAASEQWAKALINPRQASFHVYADSPIVVPDAEASDAGIAVGAPLPNMPIRVDGQHTHLQLVLPRAGFTLLLFSDELESRQVEPLLRECTRLAIQPLLVSASEPVKRAGCTTVGDPIGRLAASFAAREFPIYLVRPDEHVAARWRSARRSCLETALNIATGRRTSPAARQDMSSRRSDPQRIESLYEALALALDAADRRNDESFLARLALVLAHGIGDEARLRSLIAAAQQED